MKKTELVITSKPEDNFVHGTCSSCPATQFKATGNSLGEKALLRRMVDSHFRSIHAREDASQAAAGIVSEAAEGLSILLRR
jgi:hypothetical protein